MKNLTSYLGIGLGSFLFAFGINNFILANGLGEGGFTGLSLIIHYFTGWPVGMILLVLNIPLVIIGWMRWGFTFFFKTLLGVISVSLAIDLTQGFTLQTKDLLLAALYGGAFTGTGLGIVLLSGATTGGVDIIARFIQQKYGITMGKTYLTFDFFVLSLMAIFFGMEIALYTLVAVYVFSQIVDRILEGFNQAKAVMIVSDKSDVIAKTILQELERGATIIKGYGAFTGRDRNILYVVVGKYQLLNLKKIVRYHDSKAFVVVNNVYEVLGEGFRPPT